MWGGHSCPPTLIWIWILDRENIINTNTKSGGQECPPHTVSQAAAVWLGGGSVGLRDERFGGSPASRILYSKAR